MGTAPSIVEHVYDGDMQMLKEALSFRRKELHITEDDNEKSSELYQELEEAVHAIVGMEIHSSQQFQQLQIALQMVLNVAPSVLQTFETNSAEWNALHRAAVTGNLAFVPFMFEQYGEYVQDNRRDAFGLFPVDLVPPELVKSRKKTTKNRRDYGLELLFEAKNKAQQATIMEYVVTGVQTSTSEDAEGNQEEQQPDKNPQNNIGGYLQLQPCVENFGEDAMQIHGFIHEHGMPLRIRYHLPKVELFECGYFQLIWRASDEPLGEEPHYDRHTLVRDEIYPHQVRDEEPQDDGVEMIEISKEKEKHRQLAEENPILEGFVSFDTSHLPDDALVHVLFVACDRHMLKRTVVLSTHACMLKLSCEEYTFPESPEKIDLESPHFTFTVAGEEFVHSSPDFSGLSFDSLESFEEYVLDKKSSTIQKEDSLTASSRSPALELVYPHDESEPTSARDELQQPTPELSSE